MSEDFEMTTTNLEKARELFERRQAKKLNMPYEDLKNAIDQYEDVTGKRYGEESVNKQQWEVWIDAWESFIEEGYLLIPIELDDDSARKLTEDSWDMGNHGLDLNEYTVEQVAPYKEQWIQNYSEHYKKKHKEFIDKFRKLNE